jgi:hypothetical protein
MFAARINQHTNASIQWLAFVRGHRRRNKQGGQTSLVVRKHRACMSRPVSTHDSSASEQCGLIRNSVRTESRSAVESLPAHRLFSVKYCKFPATRCVVQPLVRFPKLFECHSFATRSVFGIPHSTARHRPESAFLN